METALDDVDMFTAEFLVERPLLSALRHPGPRPAVLLVDEVDRADDEFEAFLFEVLAESSVTIPELGTQRAEYPPIVVLTSNRTRDLHDALKRRCLYHWIDYPSPARGSEIIRMHVPAARDARGSGRRRRLPAAHARRAEGARDRRGDRVGRRPEVLGFEMLDAEAADAHDRVGAEVPRGRRAARRDDGRRSFDWVAMPVDPRSSPTSSPGFADRAARSPASPSAPDRAGRLGGGAAARRAEHDERAVLARPGHGGRSTRTRLAASTTPCSRRDLPGPRSTSPTRAATRTARRSPASRHGARPCP